MPETYICEEGASGIGHPDDQDISKPIKDAGDGHTNIDDVVETDVAYRKVKLPLATSKPSASQQQHLTPHTATVLEKQVNPTVLEKRVIPTLYSIEEGQAILSNHNHQLSQPSIDIGWKMVRILQ